MVCAAAGTEKSIATTSSPTVPIFQPNVLKSSKLSVPHILAIYGIQLRLFQIGINPNRVYLWTNIWMVIPEKRYFRRYVRSYHACCADPFQLVFR